MAQTIPDPSINQCTQFSYLGVPAAAGMNDWYENNYPLPPNSSFPRRRESRGEVRVVAMTLELFHQPMHPNFHTLVCRRQPAWVIAMKARPVPRYGAGVQGWGNPVAP